MKTFKTIGVAAVLACLGAGAAMAQLSDTWKNWAEGPVQFLMTDAEQSAWKKVRTDAEAEAFVDLFWARRDPTPATERNEWREAFEKRVAIADERFEQGRVRGALTDRGKILILFGAPTRIQGSEAATDRTRLEELGAAADTPTVKWIYDAPVLDEAKLAECREIYEDGVCRLFMTSSGTPPFATTPEFEVAFVDQNATNNWKLTQGRRSDVPGLLRKAEQFYLFQPDLKEVPRYAEQVTIPGSEIQPATSFSSKELETAYRDFRAMETSPYANVWVSYGEYVTAAGDYFVPVQLYVHPTEAIAPNKEMSFFGVIEDSAGKIVQVFEEPVTVAESKGDIYVDKSLTLQPGDYVGSFGLAVANEPVTIATTKMTLSGIDASKPGISPLLLSDNIFPLTKPQLPTDPFAFGGIKVVPKSDRTFTTADELWYFFELRNPGLDATTNQPKVQVGVEVKGTTADGKTKRMRNPLMEVPAQELKGVPGHYAVGSAIPLATLPPGEYTIELKVLDTINKQSWTLKEPFTVVNP